MITDYNRGLLLLLVLLLLVSLLRESLLREIPRNMTCKSRVRGAMYDTRQASGSTPGNPHCVCASSCPPPTDAGVGEGSLRRETPPCTPAGSTEELLPGQTLAAPADGWATGNIAPIQLKKKGGA
eukprot:3902916-Rhodomonas_salina.1